MIPERSVELGRLIGQSEEFQTWKRANDGLKDEPELRTQLERLRNLEITLSEQLERGETLSPQQKDELDQVQGTVQSSAAFQRLVAAQSNYDKLMVKVQQWIAEGITKGAGSRIITLG